MVERLHLVVRGDLPPGAQAVQAVHAARQFAFEHAEVEQRWFDTSNTLALLAVPDEVSLLELLELAGRSGARVSVFREPDLGGAATAIAVEPGAKGRRLCRRLPRALAPMA